MQNIAISVDGGESKLTDGLIDVRKKIKDGRMIED